MFDVECDDFLKLRVQFFMLKMCRNILVVGRE